MAINTGTHECIYKGYDVESDCMIRCVEYELQDAT